MTTNGEVWFGVLLFVAIVILLVVMFSGGILR